MCEPHQIDLIGSCVSKVSKMGSFGGAYIALEEGTETLSEPGSRLQMPHMELGCADSAD